VAKALGVPLVGTNHTAVEDFFPLGSVMRSYDAWYYNHCAVVTTPYKMLISRMREKGFHRPAHVVANPVDIASFRPATIFKESEDPEGFCIWFSRMGKRIFSKCDKPSIT
jgi:glycosyltransferase involved in cell wall biosynthesis